MAAHEYAHLLIDQEDISGEVCGPFRAHELDELRAGAFATAFLLPPAGIAAALEDVDAPGEVSFERALRLGHDLGASYHAMVALLEREGVKVAVQAFHPRSRAFGCFLFSEALGPCVIVNRSRT